MCEFLKKENPLFQDNIYLAKLFTAEQRRSPITDPVIIMMNVNKQEAVKQEIIQNSWLIFPRVRQIMNVMEGNSDQVINFLSDQFNNLNGQLQLMTSIDGKYYNKYSFDINILYYPGTIIFLKQPFRQIQVNDTINLVSNQVTNLSDYDYPSNIYPIKNYQFTSFHCQNQQPEDKISILNIDMYDKRLLTCLTNYINAVNPYMIFTCKGSYYRGSVDEQFGQYTTIFLEKQQMTKQYTVPEDITEDQKTNIMECIIQYYDNEDTPQLHTDYINEQQYQQLLQDGYIYNTYTVFCAIPIYYTKNMYQQHITKHIQIELQTYTETYKYNYTNTDIQQGEIYGTPEPDTEQLVNDFKTYIKYNENQVQDINNEYQILQLQQYMPYFVYYIQNLSIESNFLLSTYAMYDDNDNVTSYFIQYIKQTSQDLQKYNIDTQYLTEDLIPLQNYDIIKNYILLPVINQQKTAQEQSSILLDSIP